VVPRHLAALLFCGSLGEEQALPREPFLFTEEDEVGNILATEKKTYPSPKLCRGSQAGVHDQINNLPYTLNCRYIYSYRRFGDKRGFRSNVNQPVTASWEETPVKRGVHRNLPLSWGSASSDAVVLVPNTGNRMSSTPPPLERGGIGSNSYHGKNGCIVWQPFYTRRISSKEERRVWS